MRMKCIGAQSVQRPTPPGHTNKGMLALCRRAAVQGEHRTYVKPPGAGGTPTSALQMSLF